MVHFRREKYVPRGGPDGGDGGKGGDVILVVKPEINTLFHFRHRTRFAAEEGARGGTSNKTGRSGQDLQIPVPPGTLVYDEEAGDVLGDLTESGRRMVICRGGRGGRGNTRFKSARNQTPRLAEKGEPGEERRLRLELKLIADIGLVGVPNAGKSTLLSAVTSARPKIAPYPFTTLVPNLGVAALDDETSLVLADIPGLIEGAHAGSGLGHEFLRHIQRTRVLIHLLDGTSQDPVADFIQINAELSLFDPALAEKPQIPVLNKIDLLEVQSRWSEIEKQLQALDYQPMQISAVAGTHVRQLLFRAAELLKQAPWPQPVDEIPVYRMESDPRAFEVHALADGSGYRVQGRSIERAAAMTYWEHDQSARRFQRILETLGIDQALREAGIRQGDSVFIGEIELEWSD